eukprot:g8127.t1
MMGKSSLRRSCGGPCTHCHVTVTPCWRKGPPEKPILCNACGARYLVKRTLDGYMPGQRTSAKHKRSQQWNTQHRNKIHRNDTSSSGSSDFDPFDHGKNIKNNSKQDGVYGHQKTDRMNKNNVCLFDLSRIDKTSLENEAHMAACTLALLRYSSTRAKTTTTTATKTMSTTPSTNN